MSSDLSGETARRLESAIRRAMKDTRLYICLDHLDRERGPQIDPRDQHL